MGTKRNYSELLREQYWKRISRPLRPSELSWKLEPTQLKEAWIVWPSEYTWKPAGKWYEQIRQSLGRFIKIVRRDIPQPAGAILALEVSNGRRTVPVLIDIRDTPLIDKVDPGTAELYFKLQHDEAGYDFDNVVPGGYVPNSSEIYHYLSHLRKQKDRRPPRFDVYGRFGTAFATEVRARALTSLTEQRQFQFEGGPKRIRYSRYLEEVSRSSVVIDLPGNGPFCFRLVDYLALGSCVVAARHGTTLHVPLEDMTHLAYAKPDMSDLVSVCGELLEQPELRREMVESSREYFDRYLHTDQLAAYYLHLIMPALE